VKPKVFIGSAVEALDVAYAVQQNLEHSAEPTVWDQGVFNLSRSAAESLVEILQHMDFGVFIFTPDDVVKIRGEENKATRDNVIFELGLFVGALGRDRSFIFMPRQQEDLHLPTDLIGFTPATYDAERSDRNFRAATGPACQNVREAISSLGARPRDAQAENAPQQNEESIESTSLEEEELTVPNRPTIEPSEEAIDTEPKTSEQWVDKMIIDFISNDDLQSGEEAYKQAQDAESDETGKLRIEAIYWHLRYMRGDVIAFEKLQGLVERTKEVPEVLPIVHNFIGVAYERGDDFLKAQEAYEAAARTAQQEEKRARYVTSAAECLYVAGNRDEAFHRVTTEIDKSSDHQALSLLYAGLASLYERADISDLRAIALQKAIEYKPNDTKLRFDAARSFSDSKFAALALMNYQTMLRFTPDNAAALNNIGIIYGEMEMLARQSDSYKKAVEKGNTLAAANLAYEYIKAGFMDEATEVLNKAKEKEDVHPNVGSALATVAGTKEAESKTEQEALSAAREQRQFVLSFAQAYFNEPSTNPQYEGSWRFSDGVEVEIRRKNSELEIRWERNDREHNITMRTQNRGALITKYSRQDPYLSTSLGNKG